MISIKKKNTKSISLLGPINSH